jgi:hypothetical protein
MMAVDVGVMDEPGCRRQFLEHRVAFSAEALAPYAGRWIAWSPDGGSIVAAADAPEDLDDRIRAAGEDPEWCVVEGIPTTGATLGGAGLGLAGPSSAMLGPSNSSICSSSACAARP